jgi:hypothetical protein
VRRVGKYNLQHLPMAVVEVSSAGALDMLTALPGVKGVVPDLPKQRMLAQSLPLISQPAAAAKGYLGGPECDIAVLDTGETQRCRGAGGAGGFDMAPVADAPFHARH